MAESYVYIDAPSLDNADRCAFLVNDSFKYVVAGQGSDVAQFPLYEKFLSSNELNRMTDLSDLMRTDFIPGKVASNSESTTIGGDYALGNTCIINAKNFKVGRLTGFKFRLYKKGEITTANRTESFEHSLVDDYNEVAQRVAIYGPTFDYYKIKGKRFKYIIEEIKKNGLPLKPGVKELLKVIKEKNIKCAIATTSTRAFIDEYRKYDNEFFNMFDGIITGDEILYGKPNPDIFLKCCKMFNINVNDALVLEDSKTGIIAAHNGNIKSCFIEDLVPLDGEIKKYATYLFDSLLDVIKLI
jgi:HAD superfamily hydrolase (TIGR01509 family)